MGLRGGVRGHKGFDLTKDVYDDEGNLSIEAEKAGLFCMSTAVFALSAWGKDPSHEGRSISLELSF